MSWSRSCSVIAPPSSPAVSTYRLDESIGDRPVRSQVVHPACAAIVACASRGESKLREDIPHHGVFRGRKISPANARAAESFRGAHELRHQLDFNRSANDAAAHQPRVDIHDLAGLVPDDDADQPM